jgi:diadenylate cyclase
MSRVKTGALIVIENEHGLDEYCRTGIDVDGIVTNQLLINIFEHNTPLHDGAVIMKGKRIISATCYLPLSDNMGISKELGTRHRAALGMSEATDSIVVVVSEETGAVSLAHKGTLLRGVATSQLREKLVELGGIEEEKKVNIRLWKGRAKNEGLAKK